MKNIKDYGKLTKKRLYEMYDRNAVYGYVYGQLISDLLDLHHTVTSITHQGSTKKEIRKVVVDDVYDELVGLENIHQLPALIKEYTENLKEML